MIRSYLAENTDSGVEITIGNKSMVFEGVSQDQMARGQIKYAEGEYIQNAFSFLNADQREFLMSGLLPEEFDELFAEEDDDFEYTYFT